MSKLVNLSNLDRLTKAIEQHYKGLIDTEQARALAQEQILLAEINLTKEMFDGRAFKYVTQNQYDALTDDQKNDVTVTYFVTDAEDLSHTHGNKEFLDDFQARNITIGSKTQLFDGTNDLIFSISDIGASHIGHEHDEYYTKSEIDAEFDNIQGSVDDKAPAVHSHNDQYYTEAEMDVKLAAKSNTTHTHDDRYYTEGEVDNLIDGVSGSIASTSSSLQGMISDKADKNHNHDDDYYTEDEIDSIVEEINDSVGTHVSVLQSAINGKANSSHGNHVPDTETANNAKFLRNDNTWQTVTPANIGAAAEGHNHDDAYFTQAQINSKLDGKSDTTHSHDDKYYTETEINTKFKDLNDSIDGRISDLNTLVSNKAPSTHSHDDTYYTESEIDNKLANKSDKTHDHDDKYYTEDEIDGKIATINANIAKKSDSGHSHPEYSIKAEIENDLESITESLEGIGTEISGLQSALSGKAPSSHTHDDIYYTKTEMNTKLAGKSDSDHDHDSKYYLKSEMDTTVGTLRTAIDGKSASGHTHDDRYYTESEIDTKISNVNSTITSKETSLKSEITTAKAGAISESKTYTDTAISKLVGTAPEAMNTLQELAQAIGDHQDEYDAYVDTVSTAINKAKTDAISEADKKDTALHTTISAEIDADVLVEKQRAMQAEAALEGHIAEKAPSNHTHDDRYYTESEINAKVSALQKEIDTDVEVEKTRAMEAESTLQAAINGKANSSHGNHVPTTQTANNAKFLRCDNTWQTVTPANIGAAASSHGNHVPATETANNAKFLRNDNTWATVTPANIGAAASSHSHDDKYYTEAEINTKIETINTSISTNVATLQANIDKKANSSHGNHVPTTQTANNKTFLRCDNTWQTVTPENIGAATSTHDHNTVYYTQTKVNELLNAKSNSSHTHDDRYFTESEINTKIDTINTTINNNHASLTSSVNGKADKTHTHSMSDIQESVVTVTPSGNKLTLTTDRIQYTAIGTGTEIVFPNVAVYTEIHLFFDSTTNMSLVLPDTCRWRLDSNIEAGKSYELIAKYVPGPNRWLVNILVYS